MKAIFKATLLGAMGGIAMLKRRKGCTLPQGA